MKRLNAVLAAAVALGLAACGGSSGSSGGSSGTTARVSQGALTAVSAAGAARSITVNGTVVDDSAATVKIDDNPTGHEALQPGMVVTVKIDDKGKATEITHRAQARGHIDAKGTSSVTIAGQVVRVDDSTHFEDNVARLGALGANDFVRVSGFPDDRGGLRATRIEKDKSTQFEFEVHGIVSNLNASAGSFTLTASNAPGAASWTVQSASLPAGLKDGSIVEVRSTTQVAAGGTIANATVKLDDDLSGESEAEVEGIVTSVATAPSASAAGQFVIRGITVNATATTKWVGGAPADLVAGVKVEAEGALDASGAITATKVSFRDSLRFQSTAAGITRQDAHNGSFTMLGGTLTVHVSDVTDFDEIADLSALTTQNVEVRAYPSSTSGNDVVATRIRLARGGGNPSTRVLIQGPVSNVSGSTFKILGYTIDASGATPLTRDDNPSSSDLPATLSQLTDGTVVKAQANDISAFTASSLTLKAKEIELEDDK